MTQLACNLRAARGRSGLTQVEVAAKAGITPETLAAIESGKTLRPHSPTLSRIADALGIDSEILEGAIAARPTTGQSNSGQPAVDSVRTDQSPASQGEDMQSRSDASTTKPPAGESQQDANPDETLAESA